MVTYINSQLYMANRAAYSSGLHIYKANSGLNMNECEVKQPLTVVVMAKVLYNYIAELYTIQPKNLAV